MSNAQARLDLLRQLPASKLKARIPAWARNAGAFVKPFAPDLRQFIPRGPITIMSNEPHRAWLFEHEFKRPPDNPIEYAAEFERASRHKPHAIEWIKPVDGSYA
jgi:hypothetical protein